MKRSTGLPLLVNDAGFDVLPADLTFDRDRVQARWDIHSMSTDKPRRARKAADIAATTADTRADTFSRSEYVVILGVIVVFALGARAVMLVDFMRSNPIAGSPDGDAAVYWEMAGRIAGGEWIDRKPFHSVPLYPYALALVRALGGGLITVYILQLLIHVATAVLLARLTAQKLGRACGLIAAALFVLLQEPAFLSARLLPSTLQLLVVTAVLLAAQRFWIRRGLGDAALVGGMTGLLSLIYPPAMVLVLLLIPWMTLIRAMDRSGLLKKGTGSELMPDHATEKCPRRGACTLYQQAPGGPGRSRGLKPAARGRRGQGLLCGTMASVVACLVILPATWHNWKACGEFIPITAHAGVTFRQGNAPGSDGVYTAIEGVSPARQKMHLDTARVYAAQTGRSGTYGEISRYFFAQGSDYLVSDAGRAFWLVVRKFYWFLTGRHYSDIYFPSFEQDDGWVNLLPLAPLPTAWLMGPALVGLIVCRRGRHTGWKPVPHCFHAIDWAMLLLPVLIVMAFWYSPRYRLPALPMLVMASAGAVAATLGSLTRRRGSRKSAGAVIVLIAVSIATGPINGAIGFDRAEDFKPQYECNRGHMYAQLGQYDWALEQFIESDRLQPDQSIVLAAMAEAYTRLSRFGEAERVCNRLSEVDPDSIATWLAHGSLHCGRGQWADAQGVFEKCLTIDALSAEAHWGMWLSLSNSDRSEEGVAHLRQVVQLDRNHAAAASEYGIWLATHKPRRIREEADAFRDQAEYYLQRARRLSPHQPEAHFNLGMLLMEAGRMDEAALCFRDALQLDPAYGKAQQALTEIERRSTRSPSALRPTGESAPQTGEPRATPPADSVASLKRQIEVRPDDASLYSRLAGMLHARGDAEQAVAVLHKAIANADDTTTVTVELAWLLSTSPVDTIRNGQEAVRLVLDVLGRLPDTPPEYLDVYAAALAETGQFDRAAQEAQRAAAIAAQQERKDLAETIRQRVKLYESQKPFRY
ncbi:MAG: tetratricopeptide repeat protein [Planctomycetota bacterium]|jgi:tetratricopeptide (TPR) repeat protein